MLHGDQDYLSVYKAEFTVMQYKVLLLFMSMFLNTMSEGEIQLTTFLDDLFDTTEDQMLLAFETLKAEGALRSTTDRTVN